ncbi:MAG TPA: hypothetical protein VN854_00980 [Mycoplasmatales bacterium]|jgi:hypothetical protein|nr:hypothetical protein [Mycoplasmatales bacterium]
MWDKIKIYIFKIINYRHFIFIVNVILGFIISVIGWFLYLCEVFEINYTFNGNLFVVFINIYLDKVFIIMKNILIFFFDLIYSNMELIINVTIIVFCVKLLDALWETINSKRKK